MAKFVSMPGLPVCLSLCLSACLSACLPWLCPRVFDQHSFARSTTQELYSNMAVKSKSAALCSFSSYRSPSPNRAAVRVRERERKRERAVHQWLCVGSPSPSSWVGAGQARQGRQDRADSLEGGSELPSDCGSGPAPPLNAAKKPWRRQGRLGATDYYYYDYCCCHLLGQNTSLDRQGQGHSSSKPARFPPSKRIYMTGLDDTSAPCRLGVYVSILQTFTVTVAVVAGAVQRPVPACLDGN
ncbi:hypothetical protein EJ05DRAFT_489649 [Pseudovirgaria hyperparasitica]|uniref:Secreted protein n=1 Tax=Pseudovirgaria hyperparasitica TaxID=470096 RepID=A0A6A6VVW5_9PEZI|nr:uncharacterized protein EJ05DRAFT_489649 [Pseudovirgaria hyperparasitica]KAF2753936.1 hypothetical protein EJ05DRAFT_489649 [Pseudovirgaria hyperparasitica]